MFYFAYGSNMNIFELKKYCNVSDITIYGKGFLNNYSFSYVNIKNKKHLKGKATIEPKNNSKVYGIIYKIKNNLYNLHKKEGLYNNIYYIKKKLQVYSTEHKKYFNCFTYIMSDHVKLNKNNPSIKYRNKILPPAIVYKFPNNYIKKLLSN